MGPSGALAYLARNVKTATKEFDELLFEYGLELDEDVSTFIR